MSQTVFIDENDEELVWGGVDTPIAVGHTLDLEWRGEGIRTYRVASIHWDYPSHRQVRLKRLYRFDKIEWETFDPTERSRTEETNGHGGSPEA